MSARTDPVTFRQFDGLRNTVTEERLGPSDLARAINVDLDDAGQPRRRRGASLAAAGHFHSLYTNKGVTYVVKDGDLCALRPDYSTLVIRAGIGTEAPVAYTAVGSTVYYSSAGGSGVIEDLIHRDWGKTNAVGTWLSPVVNPTVNLPEVAGQVLMDPPVATSLAYYSGRIYMAQGSTLWATQLYTYELIDATRNYFLFEHDITGMAAVSDGLYVGTTSAVYFLRGPFTGMARGMVVASPLVPGSMIAVDAERLPSDLDTRGAKKAVMFLTGTGLYVGLDSGVCSNLTQGRFNFPSTQSAAVMFREQDGISQYVGTLNSSGTPIGNIRYGDYVDAEIRRFQST